MLQPIGLPNKKATPEQQMAAMRNYINQLKDDTEQELFNIRWENLSKPLQEKLNGLDKEIVANSNKINQIQANFITADQIAAQYVTSEYLDSDFIYTKTLNASQITAGKINTEVFNASMLEAEYINASKQIKTSKLDATVVKATDITAYGGSFYYLSATQLDAAYMSTDYLDVNDMIRTDKLNASVIVATELYVTGTTVIKSARLSVDQIATVFSSSNTAEIDRLNLGYVPKSNTSSALRIAAGGSYANVYLKATNIQGQYYLVVNMPD